MSWLSGHRPLTQEHGNLSVIPRTYAVKARGNLLHKISFDIRYPHPTPSAVMVTKLIKIIYHFKLQQSMIDQGSANCTEVSNTDLLILSSTIQAACSLHLLSDPWKQLPQVTLALKVLNGEARTWTHGKTKCNKESKISKCTHRGAILPYIHQCIYTQVYLPV